MSKIGNRIIKVTSGVVIDILPGKVLLSLAGLKKEVVIPYEIEVQKNDDGLMVIEKVKTKKSNAFHGLIARLLINAISDLSDGVSKKLELIGTGYRVNIKENTIILSVGYSRDIIINIPQDLEVSAQKNIITIKGNDRQKVGELAANIRKVRPPEVYKGKGIRYLGEHIIKKAGKAAQSVGGGSE